MLMHSQFRGWRGEKDPTKETETEAREVSAASGSQMKTTVNAAARSQELRAAKPTTGVSEKDGSERVAEATQAEFPMRGQLFQGGLLQMKGPWAVTEGNIGNRNSF